MKYRVRIDLARPVTPDYGEWLKTHCAEMLALKAQDGSALFSAATIATQRTANAYASYLVEYTSTPEHFREYEAQFAEPMRSVFRETYSDITPFTFTRTVSEE